MKLLNLGAKTPYLVILGEEILKTIVILEISTLKFVKFQKPVKNKKSLNLASKMPYWAFLTENPSFSYFWVSF